MKVFLKKMKRMKNEKLVNKVKIVILMPLNAWSLVKLSVGVEGYNGDGSSSLTMTHINSDIKAQAWISKQG
jgi:hypothetical protein